MYMYLEPNSSVMVRKMILRSDFVSVIYAVVLVMATASYRAFPGTIVNG